MLNYNLEEIETPKEQIEAAIKEENYEKQREEMEEQPRLTNKEAFKAAKQSVEQTMKDQNVFKVLNAVDMIKDYQN